MGKEGGVKVNSHVSLFGKFHPLRKMLRLQRIAVRIPALLKDSVARMEIQLFLSRHQPKRLIHILHQLLRRPGPSRIIAGCLDSPGQGPVMVKAGHVIPLPAVERHGSLHAFSDGRLYVHAVGGVNLFCGFKSCHLIFSFL